MGHHIVRRVAGLCTLAAVTASSTSAHAYNWETHKRMVEVASYIMHFELARPPVPVGIDPQEWTAYLDAVAAAPSRLEALTVGPIGVRFNQLGSDDPTVCGYYTIDNMATASRTRIMDWTYSPIRSGGPCGAKYEPDEKRRLGSVLGFHAASVDDHTEDSVMWFRPTSGGYWGVVKEYASRAIEYAAGALLLPFVCLGNLIFGSGCDLDESFELARKYNPVEWIEGWLPGFGSWESEDFTGLWHFMHVDSTTNRFNDIRGMWYEGAGPTHPGAMDVAIMVGADVSGLSLMAFDARGDNRYGQHDAIQRYYPQWQAHAIGHLEFSPLDNLAQFGWVDFTRSPTVSERLGWPLHALGDAAEPHHTVGTTSFGHRPFEDFVDQHFFELILDDRQANRPITQWQADIILQWGFNVWKLHRAEFADGRLPTQAIVTELAKWTNANAPDQVFSDGASITFILPGFKNESIQSFNDSRDAMRMFLEVGIGYMVTYLTAASLTAKDPGPNPNGTCPAGTHYDYRTANCVTGPATAPPGPVPPPNPPPPIVPGCPPHGCADGGTGTCESGKFCPNGDECDPVTEFCSEGCCMPGG